ncbi:hypothetical protein BU15DRAFT_65616 [Melanogaster broomeanus]|nr:hypothetical protein BU15DRAFT_65616 [Melanogaster broomeanus]
MGRSSGAYVSTRHGIRGLSLELEGQKAGGRLDSMIGRGILPCAVQSYTSIRTGELLLKSEVMTQQKRLGSSIGNFAHAHARMKNLQDIEIVGPEQTTGACETVRNAHKEAHASQAKGPTSAEIDKDRRMPRFIDGYTQANVFEDGYIVLQRVAEVLQRIYVVMAGGPSERSRYSTMHSTQLHRGYPPHIELETGPEPTSPIHIGCKLRRTPDTRTSNVHRDHSRLRTHEFFERALAPRQLQSLRLRSCQHADEEVDAGEDVFDVVDCENVQVFAMDGPPVWRTSKDTGSIAVQDSHRIAHEIRHEEPAWNMNMESNGEECHAQKHAKCTLYSIVGPPQLLPTLTAIDASSWFILYILHIPPHSGQVLAMMLLDDNENSLLDESLQSQRTTTRLQAMARRYLEKEGIRGEQVVVMRHPRKADEWEAMDKGIGGDVAVSRERCPVVEDSLKLIHYCSGPFDVSLDLHLSPRMPLLDLP